MSTITLDTLNTIAQPVNTYLPAPIDADLASFVNTVNTLADNGRLNVLVEAFAPKAAPAPRKAAAPALRRTKNGGMMNTTPGSITNGQLDKLIALCDELGEPLSRTEVAALCDYSMADASDYRFDILNG